MNSLLETIPRPIAATAIVHLAASAALGVVFADRLAESIHVPACQTALTSVAAQSQFTAQREYDRKRQIFEDLLKQLPAVDMLPIFDGVTRLVQRPAEVTQGQNFSSKCECLADLAKSETRLDHMIWVATFRFYVPTGVSRFDGVMGRLRQTGRCSVSRVAQ